MNPNPFLLLPAADMHNPIVPDSPATLRGTRKTTLAIGDGANDVGMIQEADIGISGVELNLRIMIGICLFTMSSSHRFLSLHWEYLIKMYLLDFVSRRMFFSLFGKSFGHFVQVVKKDVDFLKKNFTLLLGLGLIIQVHKRSSRNAELRIPMSEFYYTLKSKPEDVTPKERWRNKNLKVFSLHFHSSFEQPGFNTCNMIRKRRWIPMWRMKKKKVEQELIHGVSATNDHNNTIRTGTLWSTVAHIITAV
ncbi:unnamed protein product [Lactuca saligna]|uniref:Uncharacterized protein n=1 Tax=Lactuca saligna TaxID=75948 RepID=A0AA36EI65_LACSI|nr:unnamed protein product [Lactuca saligna]